MDNFFGWFLLVVLGLPAFLTVCGALAYFVAKMGALGFLNGLAQFKRKHRKFKTKGHYRDNGGGGDALRD